jgi:outer membrane protein assembly factor BamD (BamD/ComL family)
MPGIKQEKGFQMRYSTKNLILSVIIALGVTSCDTNKREWEQAQKANTIEAYEHFLSRHPHDQNVPNALARLEQLHLLKLWEQTQQSNTIESYTNFLQKYAQSQYAYQAQEKIVELEYQEVAATNTLESYKGFLEKHPTGKYADRANTKLLDLSLPIDYEKAKTANTIEAYKDFLERYPPSQYTDQAREKIVELEYQEATAENTLESYKDFLEKLPQGTWSSKYADLARAKLLELSLPIDYEKAKTANTIEAYKAFVNRHPNSVKTNEIRSLLEKLLYKSVISQKTISAYQDYLTYFPTGYRSQEILILLEPKLYTRTLDENTTYACESYLGYFPTGYNADRIRDRLALLQQAAYSENQAESIIFDERSKDYTGSEQSKFLDTYTIVHDIDEDKYLYQARRSEEYILSKINDRGYVPSDVCYYTKANQLLLTHLSNFLITIYINKKILDVLYKELESKQYRIHSKSELDEYNTIVEVHNKLLKDFNKRIDQFNRATKLFYDKIQPFSALLPLEKLNRYTYSSGNIKRAEAHLRSERKTATVYVLEAALSLLSSGKVKCGLILLESIGQIKIAYLGILLMNLDNDMYARQKFEILQEDLNNYYKFVAETTVMHEYQIHNELRRTLDQYRYNRGIFDSYVFTRLEEYYKSKTLADMSKALKRY